jgi:hypothetical protein
LRTRPVTVKGVAGATAIAAADFFTCALLADGGVRCWGGFHSFKSTAGRHSEAFGPAAVLLPHRPRTIAASNGAGRLCALFTGVQIP